MASSFGRRAFDAKPITGIKNSFQIVASLLTTQAAREESQGARSALVGAAARIRAIAGIHDALQANPGQDVVDLGNALTAMCASLQAMAGDPLGISIDVEVEALAARAEIAQPILLAVNELVINAIRHAFPDGRRGTIKINLSRSPGQIRVVVADDGVGLPAHHHDGGFGTRLVRMMAEQIGGVVSQETRDGSRFTLTSPDR